MFLQQKPFSQANARHSPVWHDGYIFCSIFTHLEICPKASQFATYQINSKNFPRLSKRQNLAKSEEALVLNAEGLTTSLDEYLILN